MWITNESNNNNKFIAIDDNNCIQININNNIGKKFIIKIICLNAKINNDNNNSIIFILKKDSNYINIRKLLYKEIMKHNNNNNNNNNNNFFQYIMRFFFIITEGQYLKLTQNNKIKLFYGK